MKDWKAACLPASEEMSTSGKWDKLLAFRVLLSFVSFTLILLYTPVSVSMTHGFVTPIL